MGQCVSTNETAKYSLGVLRQCLKRFKDKVQLEIQKLSKTPKGPKKQLNKIQAIIEMIDSFNKLFSQFYEQFQNQKKPAYFINSIESMRSLLNEIWNDHNMALSFIDQHSQQLHDSTKASNNSNNSKDNYFKNSTVDSSHDIKKNMAIQSKDASNDELNIKIEHLKAIIERNDKQSTERERQLMAKLQQKIKQKTHQIEEISFQLAIANSQLLNKESLTDREKNYIQRIQKHQQRFKDFQNKLQQNRIKEERLQKQIKQLQEQKTKLQQKILQIQSTTTPSPQFQEFIIHSSDEQLKAENQSLIKRLRETKDELNRLKNFTQESSQSDITPMLRSTDNPQSSKFKLQTEIKQKERIIISLKEQIETNRKKLQSSYEKIQKLTTDLRKAQSNLFNTSTIKINHDKEIFSLEKSLSTKERQIYQLNNDLNKLRQEIEFLNSQWESKLKQEQNKLRQNQENQKKLLVQIKNYKTIIENLQSDKSQSEKAQFNLDQLRIQLSQLEKQNLSIKMKLDQSLESFQKEKKDLKDSFRAKQAEKQKKFQEQKGKFQKQVQNWKKKNDSKNEELNSLSESFQQKCAEVETLKTQKLTPVGRCFTQYFCGRILNYENQKETEWFVKNLELKTGRAIVSTSLLYRFDKENKTSFHHYIDNKPNIVIIIKMANREIISGYSEAPFKPKTNIDYRQGFMFAFHNRKIFTLKKEPTNKFNKVIPRPVTYDDYFLMWGNSDIKIKSGTDELFSVYATPNCCYEERGNDNSKVDDLFGQEERETFLLDYELYEVKFDGSQY